ncbi:hypothetical protein ACJQWK_08152 [Exserohilum turcicum]
MSDRNGGAGKPVERAKSYCNHNYHALDRFISSATTAAATGLLQKYANVVAMKTSTPS